jgi:hypothetical protein
MTSVAHLSTSFETRMMSEERRTDNEPGRKPAPARRKRRWCVHRAPTWGGSRARAGFLPDVLVLEQRVVLSSLTGWSAGASNPASSPDASSGPDLAVVTATAPTSGVANATIDVSWTVQNVGDGSAQGTWYDAVFIGSSPAFSPDLDTLLQSENESVQAPLAAGASYSTTEQAITLPGTLIGAEYLIFVTNYLGVEGEPNDALAENNDANNIDPVAITVSAPDLTITSAGAPSTAIEGGTIDLSWTVQNIGSVGAPGDWDDAVFIGSTPSFSPSADTLVQSFSETGHSPLAAGQSYAIVDQPVTVPAAATGNEFLIFVTNIHAVADQGDGTQGETSYTNNSFPVPITLTAPDLTVTSVTAPATGSTITVESTVPVSWTVKNVGAVEAPGYWSDEVYLSATQTLGGSAELLGTYDAGGESALAAGASYAASLDVFVPTGVALGHQYLIVETDATGSQPESNTTNDTLAIPIIVAAPDLLVSSAVITPGHAEAGNGATVSVNYTVTNQGPVAALGYWDDAVYLAASSTWNAQADTLIATIYPQNNPTGLAPGAHYSEQETLTIPNTVAGADYLIFVTNNDGVLGETGYYDAQAESNLSDNTLAIPIAVSTPSVDLTISQPVAPTTADVGQSIAVGFTVTNRGAETAAADWTDDVYLGTSPIYASGDRLLGSYDAAGAGESPLAAGASYSVLTHVDVPDIAPGSYDLIYVTNVGATQGETDDGNDALFEPVTITAPDLSITTATFAGNTDGLLTEGANYLVIWTVQNIGASAALGAWSDAVYLSSTPAISSGTGTMTSLGTFFEGSHAPLAAGAAYQQSQSVSIPTAATEGDEYLLVVTNIDGVNGSYEYGQPETDYANNITVIPVEISVPAPDLTVTAATAPANVTVGQQVQVAWTVANQGTDPASGLWDDAIFISSDPVIDSTSQYITEFDESNQSGLSYQPGSNTYTDTELITIPATATGDRYLIFDTNVNGTQPESDAQNNFDAIPITVSTPELVVTAATAPAAATSGSVIPVSWTVENEGTAATVDTSWTDQVYLADSPTFGPGDTYLGGVTVTSTNVLLPVAAGSHYTVSTNITLSTGLSGGHYLIIVPDGDGGQPEFGATDTTYALPLSIAVPDPAITAASAPSTALGGQSILISWTVTNEGSVATVDPWHDAAYLADGSGGEWSLAYVAIGSPDVPLAPGAIYTISQNVTVPSAPAGAYTLNIVADQDGGQPELTTGNDRYTEPFTVIAAPAAPAAPGLLPADDSGTAGDGITDQASPSLIGTTFAGTTVDLLDGGDNIVATTTADGSGAYTFSVGPLAPGAYGFSVQTVDAFGDVSSPSPAFTLTIVAAPATPGVVALLPSDDSGTPGDGITDQASPSLIGTTFAGTTVDLLDGGDNIVATTTADGSGAFTFALGPLAPGAYGYSVQTVDAFGDVSSPSAAFTLTIVAAPATPGVLALLPSDDSGTAGDRITDQASPSLIGGTFGAAIVDLLDGGDNTVATTTADGSGAFTFSLGPLAPGAYGYSVQTVDAFGDVSSPSPVFTLTIVAVPTTPRAPGLVPADDSGTLGDGITSDISPGLTGTTFAHASVDLLDGASSIIATATADGAGVYVIPVGPLAFGTFSYRVQTVDPYGNVSAPSPTLVLSIVASSNPPAAPGLLPADDSGIVGDGITDQASPSLTGTALGGATVLLLDATSTAIATTTADAAGDFTFALGSLALGTYEYRVETVGPDDAPSSPSAPFTLTIVAPPATPVAPALLAADDSGKLGDGTTDDSSPSLTGTTTAGATVDLLDPSNAIVAASIASADGVYVIPLGSLAVRSYPYRAQTVDLNGDVSDPSVVFTLTIVAAPATPAAPGLLAADDSGTQGDGITDIGSPSLTGTTFAGAIVRVLNGSDVDIATVTADGGGVYVVPLNAPSLGSSTYQVQTIDSYGDASSPSPAFSLKIVTPPSAPNAPALLPADDSGTEGDSITDNTSPSLTGTTVADGTIQLFNGNGALLGTANVGANGSYTVAVAGPLPVGSHAYAIDLIDPYGDKSGPSAAFDLTIVASPATPAAPTLLAADSNGTAGGETTDLTSPYLTGTTFAGAIVQLVNAGGTVVNTAVANGAGSYEVEVPGLLAIGSAAFHVDVIDGYGDVSGPSPAQTITVVNEQTVTYTPVVVQSLQVESIKVGLGKKKKKETVLVLQFSGALDASAADNVAAYKFAPVIKVKASGKGKNRKPATTRLGGPVAPLSAVYSASNNQVTLLPRGKLVASKPQELIVDGALVTDATGVPVDGNDDGQPGGDFIATVAGKRVTAGGILLVKTNAKSAARADMVDHVLAHGLSN